MEKQTSKIVFNGEQVYLRRESNDTLVMYVLGPNGDQAILRLYADGGIRLIPSYAFGQDGKRLNPKL